MMDSIANMAMNVSSAQLTMCYSLALTEKAMDTQELSLKMVSEMLPQQPASMGTYIDVYA